MISARAIKLSLFLAIWGSCCWAAPATVVPNMYVAEVAVASQGESDRLTAMRAALEVVLQRITGAEDIAQRPAAAVILQQSARYAQRYQYRQVAEPELASLAMTVHFDRRAIDEALRNYDLPVWAERRAVTLVWLLAPDALGASSLLDQATATGLYPELFVQAAQRGLPLLFPLLDWDDQSRLDPADVRGGFAARIEEASARYDVRHVLTLAVEVQGQLWTVRATEYAADALPRQWSAAAASSGSALAEVLNRYANRMATQYAVQGSGGWAQDVWVRVRGVGSLESYARVLSYLQELGPVQQVQVLEVAPTDNVYQVRFEGDLAGLQQAIELGRLLTPLERQYSSQGLGFQVMGLRPELLYEVHN